MPRSRPADDRVPIIDLFAGPGGLGEGFSAPVEVGGTGRFRIALSIEKDKTAHQTLELRALFRQFAHGDVPEAYYEFVRGECTRDALFQAPALTHAAAAAAAEAWNCELGVVPDAEVTRRVRMATKQSEVSVLIGGPPCQAYSLVGRSRNRGNPGYDPTADGRHTLYREYLKVLATQWPAVFVMENVKGLLSAQLDGEGIFERIMDDLQDPLRAIGRQRRASGLTKRYRLIALTGGSEDQLVVEDFPQDPQEFVVRCERFGIPQARHRVILLGVREDWLRPGWVGLKRSRQPVTTADVIADLPRVRSALSKEPDSLAAWYRTISSTLNERWFKSLKREGATAAAVVVRIAEALETARSGDLGRGGEFVAGRFRPRAHAEWYSDDRLGGVANHSARSHIAADIQRYLYAAAFADVTGTSPNLSEFPEELLPAHENVSAEGRKPIFADRFRVQVRRRPSTTVTSHISKDGHYYIHYDPSQARSLTAREAARLQTFPDNYFFCGGRTSQYQQIGNAVPPLLARQIAHVVSDIVD